MSNAPNGDRYQRRFPRWPENVVFGLYAETKTEKAVNELAMEWAGLQVADEATAFLKAQKAQEARKQRQRTAQAEGWAVGEPGE